FHEVGDVEKRVAFQSYIHKRRLHSRKHAGYASFVDGPCEGVFVFTFQVDFCKLVVFNHPDLGFMRGGRHKQFFCHANSGRDRYAAAEFTGLTAGKDGEDRAMRWPSSKKDGFGLGGVPETESIAQARKSFALIAICPCQVCDRSLRSSNLRGPLPARLRLRLILPGLHLLPAGECPLHARSIVTLL